MYLALITLPILGAIFSGFLGRKIGVKGSQIISCTSVMATTVLATLAYLETALNKISVKVHIFRWIDAEYLNVYWAFNFDSLTVSMLIPVLLISSLVHFYSIGYMSHDPHNQRFFSYLSLFTFMMIILVTSDNFLVMFVGWEGVGVCSYLLVSFWFTRIAANQSSLAAFFTNRVGDYVLTLGMFAILWSFGNVDYTTVFSLSPFFSETIIFLVGLCLLIGAMAKSSQIGLHVWLPMAMEGPTPVSALIHAATMVTAGVYLLMRASPLIEYSSSILVLCMWIGAVTTVFSSLIGLFQQDIKKVIAYSTMSQLGMMVIAIGLSSYSLALFHLMNHAFYKGLLFLCAGAIIHAVADNQDFRKYGGLVKYLPLTYSLMLAASLSLVAFPFMTGFYSKDLILESAFAQYRLYSIFIYFVAVIGAMFTTLYSVKVLFLTFLAKPNGSLVNYKFVKAAHEGDIFMTYPLVILAIFSIFFGYLTKDIYVGLASDFFSDNSLFIQPAHELMLDTEFALPFFYKLLPLFFTIVMTLISLILSEFYPKWLIWFKYTSFGYKLFGFLNQRFLVEMIYNKYISSLVLKFGEHTTKVLDKGAVELVGPYGLEEYFSRMSKSINDLSTGLVTNYALYIFVGLIAYLSLLHSVKGLALLFILSLFFMNLRKKLEHNKFVPLEQSTISAPFYYTCLILNYTHKFINKFMKNLALVYNTKKAFLTKWSLLCPSLVSLIYNILEYLQRYISRLFFWKKAYKIKVFIEKSLNSLKAYLLGSDLYFIISLIYNIYLCKYFEKFKPYITHYYCKILLCIVLGIFIATIGIFFTIIWDYIVLMDNGSGNQNSGNFTEGYNNLPNNNLSSGNNGGAPNNNGGLGNNAVLGNNERDSDFRYRFSDGATRTSVTNHTLYYTDSSTAELARNHPDILTVCPSQEDIVIHTVAGKWIHLPARTNCYLYKSDLGTIYPMKNGVFFNTSNSKVIYIDYKLNITRQVPTIKVYKP